MRFFWIPMLLLAASGVSVQAQETAAEEHAVSIHGFGTLGYAQSRNPDAEFLRDLSQPTGVRDTGSLLIDTMVGLQANYRATDAVELVAQVVSHQRYDDTFDPELTWAFVKYDMSPRVSLRVGRLGTEFLMQSDSRMVGYSYLPVRPPVNFYGEVPINYGDGADVHFSAPLADGVFKTSLSVGEAREKLPPYELNGSPFWSASLGFDRAAFQFRLIHAESKLANSIMGLAPLRDQLRVMGADAAADALDMQGTRSSYDSVGVTYDDGSWQVQAALNKVTHGTLLTENSRAGYVSIARRVGNVSPYLGYTWVRSDPKSLDTGLNGPAADAINPMVQMALQISHQDQQTRTVGLRWDFARNLDLKAQFDFVSGDPSSILLYDHLRSGWDGHTTVFSLALDFVF